MSSVLRLHPTGSTNPPRTKTGSQSLVCEPYLHDACAAVVRDPIYSAPCRLNCKPENRRSSLTPAKPPNALTVPQADGLEFPSWSMDEWYDLACVYAAASGGDSSHQQEYGDRAMELLSRAVDAGYRDATPMRKDSDLDPIREREDFKALMERLQQSQKKLGMERDPPPK